MRRAEGIVLSALTTLEDSAGHVTLERPVVPDSGTGEPLGLRGPHRHSRASSSRGHSFTSAFRGRSSPRFPSSRRGSTSCSRHITGTRTRARPSCTRIAAATTMGTARTSTCPTCTIATRTDAEAMGAVPQGSATKT